MSGHMVQRKTQALFTQGLLLTCVHVKTPHFSGQLPYIFTIRNLANRADKQMWSSYISISLVFSQQIVIMILINDPCSLLTLSDHIDA